MVEVEAQAITVVSVTKKGQATIPKKLRQKYGIKDKVLIVEEKGKGLLLKPLPSPRDEFGSLKHLFPDKTAHELIEEGRAADYERDKRLMRLVGVSDV
ncbi:MAG: AbrB/MazE/SpoVT family DNA-binding domain-containing protein [Candidatus Bathyarchaeota archaeon]|nr:AbrB/MazE/SpoVT family DNA-binding domain-containing protein [Candidatus Bathyarchaeota archaeon]